MSFDRCPECNGPLPVSARSCPHCGAQSSESGPVLLAVAFVLLIGALYILFRG
jgi:predicted amidophosphoribosyltransferase